MNNQISHTFALTVDVIAENTSVEQLQSMSVKEILEIDTALQNLAKVCEKHDLMIFCNDLQKYAPEYSKRSSDSQDTLSDVEDQPPKQKAKYVTFAEQRNLRVQIPQQNFSDAPPTKVLPAAPQNKQCVQPPTWVPAHQRSYQAQHKNGRVVL